MNRMTLGRFMLALTFVRTRFYRQRRTASRLRRNSTQHHPPVGPSKDTLLIRA